VSLAGSDGLGLWLVDPIAQTGAAFPTVQLGDGRPAFAGDTLYYGTRKGIHRVKKSVDDLAIPNVTGSGGLAISPDRSLLTESECYGHGFMADVAKGTMVSAQIDDRATYVDERVDGSVVYDITREILLRRPDGTKQVLAEIHEGMPEYVTFSPSGKRVAYDISGDHPAIFLVGLDGTAPQELTSEADTQPLFLDEDHLIVTRVDANGTRPIVLTLDGSIEGRGPPGQAALDVRDGMVLVTSVDRHHLFVWEPATHKEREIALPTDAEVFAAQWSPDGKDTYLQLGAAGLEIWRLPAHGAAEKIFAAKGDDTLYPMRVSPTGRLLVSVGMWTGDLYLIPALTGALF
jgi:hypothetical protein